MKRFFDVAVIFGTAEHWLARAREAREMAARIRRVEPLDLELRDKVAIVTDRGLPLRRAAAKVRLSVRIRPGWWRRARVSHDTYSASPSPTPASRSGPTTLGCRQTGLFNVGRPDVLIGPDAFVSAAPSTTARPA